MASQAAFNTVAPSGSDAHWRVPSDTQPRLIMSASREERSHGSIFNHSNAALYLKFGSHTGMAVSGTGLFNVKVASGSLYELPKPAWQGEVWGQWDADVVGFAMVLELGDADG